METISNNNTRSQAEDVVDGDVVVGNKRLRLAFVATNTQDATKNIELTNDEDDKEGDFKDKQDAVQDISREDGSGEVVENVQEATQQAGGDANKAEDMTNTTQNVGIGSGENDKSGDVTESVPEPTQQVNLGSGEDDKVESAERTSEPNKQVDLGSGEDDKVEEAESASEPTQQADLRGGEDDKGKVFYENAELDNGEDGDDKIA